MRKAFLPGLVPAAVAVLTPSGPAFSQAEVKVALIAPMSGAWGRQGQLMQFGAEQAIEKINGEGGVKALGGAELRLVVADAGNSIEKARNATQRLVSQEEGIVAGAGVDQQFKLTLTASNLMRLARILIAVPVGATR